MPSVKTQVNGLQSAQNECRWVLPCFNMKMVHPRPQTVKKVPKLVTSLRVTSYVSRFCPSHALQSLRDPSAEPGWPNWRWTETSWHIVFRCLMYCYVFFTAIALVFVCCLLFVVCLFLVLGVVVVVVVAAAVAVVVVVGGVVVVLVAVVVVVVVVKCYFVVNWIMVLTDLAAAVFFWQHDNAWSQQNNDRGDSTK